MKRALLAVAALVALLAAADAWLAGRETRARTASRRLGTLFTADEAAELRKLPALQLELSGERHAYGRVEGRWRCLSYHMAPADGRALQAWIDALVAAEGVVHARETDDAPRYGINAPETARVSLAGPDAMRAPGGDVRATLELGRALENGVVFVRRRGTREIWACAGGLRDPLERRVAPGLPPLLAPSALPAEWLEQGGGIVEVRVERPDGGFTLRRTERELDPATLQPGALPWSWSLAPGGAERSPAAPSAWIELAQGVSEAYVALVQALPYVAVLAPEEAPADPPPVRITLAGRGAPSLQLALYPVAPGGALLRVPTTGTLYRLGPGLAELLAPAYDALAGAPEAENPWSAALPR